MRLGSICSGIGGLELGLERAGLGETVWQAEIDPHASEVLAKHWPGVPNLGDFRESGFPDCDVLVGGFPCQPVSTAGRRAGTEDERWLFDDIVDALGRMGSPPRLCVFENVRGLLSANGGAAMGRVVHGLASVGFVGRYGLLRAADVGACHRRERVFIVAAHASESGTGRDGGGLAGLPGAEGERQGDSGAPGVHRQASAHASHVGHGRAVRTRDGRTGSENASRPAPAECDGEPFAGWVPERQPRVGAGGRVLDWGPYRPAIERWEAIHGPAPAPTTDGRLSPDFVCWMQGFPPGWVDGLTRTAALRCLGNAVVPQVAERFGRMVLSKTMAVAA